MHTNTRARIFVLCALAAAFIAVLALAVVNVPRAYACTWNALTGEVKGLAPNQGVGDCTTVYDLPNSNASSSDSSSSSSSSNGGCNNVLDWLLSLGTCNTPQAQAQTTTPPMPHISADKQYLVDIAQQDAIEAGIDPTLFVRQINQESGFQTDDTSPAGAVGIAQFLPSTAAGLGVNPHDPISALRGAAQLMSRYAHNYGGDYAKALAAYNGGSGTLANAMHDCGDAWLSCEPSETQAYVATIMNR